MKSFPIKGRCLGCGRVNDQVTDLINGHEPTTGAYTVCIECGHVMVFAADLSVRNPTDDEMCKIAGDKRLLAIQKARAEVVHLIPKRRSILSRLWWTK